jgi:hypothetical protein
MKIIEIIVSPTGQTTVQTKGFAGSSCQDASRFIEQTLGTKTNEQVTPEFFYQPENQEQTAKEGM